MGGKMRNAIALILAGLLFSAFTSAHHMGSGNAPDAVDEVAHGAAAETTQTGPEDNDNAATEQGEDAGDNGSINSTGGGDGGDGPGPDR